MSAPKASDMRRLRKIGKYLLGKPRLVSKFKYQDMPSTITSFTDSDWAGCTKSAKSTSGGAICLGEHVIKTYCKQQKVIALSSAEAELYAMVAASAETLALQAYAHDLGLEFGCELYCDSAAALGIAQRAGIGKVRHLRTQGLWVQEVRVSGRIAYKKVLGEKNPADLLTKHMSADLSARHLECLNMDFSKGRAEAAPTLNSLVQATYGRRSRRDERKPRFSDKVSFMAIPAIGRQRPTPQRGTKISRSEEVSLDNVEAGAAPEVDHESEDIFGGGAIGVGLLTRGARWADAGDDFPRSHSCALDAGGGSFRKSADRQQELPLLSMQRESEETNHGEPRIEDYTWNRPAWSKEKKVSAAAPGGAILDGKSRVSFRAHSGMFYNLGRSHNRGMLSVDGMRRKSARTCLSPSACQPCVRPNSRSMRCHRSFSFAPATIPASVAGGAQTFGCSHTYANTRARSCHVMHLQHTDTGACV